MILKKFYRVISALTFILAILMPIKPVFADNVILGGELTNQKAPSNQFVGKEIEAGDIVVSGKGVLGHLDEDGTVYSQFMGKVGKIDAQGHIFNLQGEIGYIDSNGTIYMNGRGRVGIIEIDGRVSIDSKIAFPKKSHNKPVKIFLYPGTDLRVGALWVLGLFPITDERKVSPIVQQTQELSQRPVRKRRRMQIRQLETASNDSSAPVQQQTTSASSVSDNQQNTFNSTYSENNSTKRNDKPIANSGDVYSNKYGDVGRIESDGTAYSNKYGDIGRIESDGTLYSTAHGDVGRIESDGTIYSNKYGDVGRIESDGTIYSNKYGDIGRVESDGTVYSNKDGDIGRVPAGDNKAGALWLLGKNAKSK